MASVVVAAASVVRFVCVCACKIFLHRPAPTPALLSQEKYWRDGCKERGVGEGSVAGKEGEMCKRERKTENIARRWGLWQGKDLCVCVHVWFCMYVSALVCVFARVRVCVYGFVCMRECLPGRR